MQLQACLADPDGVSEYRILVNQTEIKYITVDPGVIPPDDISFELALRGLLPAFPPRTWNEGHVAKDQTTGQAIFTKVIHRDLPGVRINNVWHDTKIDHLHLKWIDRVRQNIRVVMCPLFNRPVLFKFAEFLWQIAALEQETVAYRRIDNQGIGPRFLGHVTETGRVMGFLMEYVAGRTAETEDLERCQSVLAKLHRLGLKHGDINKHNFLIRDGDREALLVDFETTVECRSEEELTEELSSVQLGLEDDSGRGGVVEDAPIAEPSKVQ